MQFLRSIWKILHLTEYFYTGTARGARNNYEVWQQTGCDALVVCNKLGVHWWYAANKEESASAFKCFSSEN